MADQEKVRLAAETASAAEDKRRGVDMIGKAEADIFLDEATAEAEEESLAAAAATDRTVTEAYAEAKKDRLVAEAELEGLKNSLAVGRA